MSNPSFAAIPPTPVYEKCPHTRRVCLTGTIASLLLGISLIGGSIYVLHIGMAATEMELSAIVRELIPLALNIGVTLLAECNGFVHAQALKWSLAREGRLTFNANLRLFTASRKHGPNAWYVNALGAVFLIIGFSSTSLVLLGRGETEFEAEPVRISGIAILILGIGISGQSLLATWSFLVTRIPTWSSSPLDTAMCMLHIVAVERVEGRCMLSVHDSSKPSEPAYPKPRQGSACAAHKEVCYVMAVIWTIVPLGAVWGAVIYALIKSGQNGGILGDNWSLFPNINGFLGGGGGGEVLYDPGATTTLNFGWGPPGEIGPFYDDPYDDTKMNLFWTLAFVSGLQAPLTLALHCAELLTTLSRDEATWRRATSKTGCDPDYNSFHAAATSWENIGLLIFKAILHWLFGLAITVYNGAGVNMRPPQIFYHTAGSLCLAAFVTIIVTRRPKGPLPATYGHVQTLVDLVDEPCRNLHWGHKGAVVNGGVNHAGASEIELPTVRMGQLYM